MGPLNEGPRTGRAMGRCRDAGAQRSASGFGRGIRAGRKPAFRRGGGRGYGYRQEAGANDLTGYREYLEEELKMVKRQLGQ